MSHEQYVLQQLQRAIDAAQGMVTGTVDILEGCALLDGLRHEIGLPDDPAFEVFRGVASETIEFPIGDVRKEYSPTGLASIDQERARYVDVIKAPVLDATRDLVSRLQAEIDRRKRSIGDR